MRQLVANLIDKMMPDPLVKADSLPSFARAMVTEQPGRRMVHILAYVPERRGARAEMIEEPIELRDVPLSLRVDGKTPQRVYLAPTEDELPFETVNGYTQTTVPVINGYAMVVFEE